MRAIVRRHKLVPGDRFVIESPLMTIVDGRLQKAERLTPPIVSVSENGQRCVLTDGTVIVGDDAAYIERGTVPVHVLARLAELGSPGDGVDLGGGEVEL